VDEIPAEEITITRIRDRKPVKLLQKLSSDGYECRKETAGIYYVSGVMFPVQPVIRSSADSIAILFFIYHPPLVFLLYPLFLKKSILISERQNF